MKSKLIAIAIFLFLYFVPFRMVFLGGEIISSGAQMLTFLSVLIGFLVAFGIGTNEPFDKKQKPSAAKSAGEESVRKAA